MHLEIPGPAGPLEALLDEPRGVAPRAAVVFAHPLPTQGGTMHTKAVFQGEREDFSAALDFMAARYPTLPLWAAGFSFGSWIALEVGAMDPRVSLLIGIAPPVTREHYTFDHLLASTKPKFLIQGDMDDICPVQALWSFYAKLKEPKEIVVIDGANHLFEGKTEEVGEALEGLLGDVD